MGLLGGALLSFVGARAGGAVEDAMNKGLPADEVFIYQDALRRGRSIVVAFPDSERAEKVRQAMASHGAETIDAARQEWWVGLRDAEREQYETGAVQKTFDQDERFYRIGFEAALDSRYRGKEYDQVLSEMSSRLEELWRQVPSTQVVEAGRRGYERGQEYYESLCRSEQAHRAA
jgi:hypothetical protein